MKSARVLGLVGAGSAAIVFGGALFLVRFWPHAASTLQNAVHAVTYACQVMWADITRGQIAYTTLGVFLLVTFLVWVGYTSYRAFRMTRHVRFHEKTIPVRVLSIAADAGLEASRLTIARNERAFAMTIGSRWPEVVISTAALQALTYEQLRAVMEHEAHHVREREPLRRLILNIALLWVPLRKLRTRLRELYVVASEVEADEQVRDQQVLGKALLQLVAPPMAAAGFSPLDARVERLLNPHYRQSGAFALRFAVVALAIAASAVGFAPRSIAAVFGDHQSPATATHIDICRQAHERMLQSSEQTCETSSTPQTCVRN